MHTPIDIDQEAVDEKIHHFMARKSPWKTLSKTIAERLAPTAESTKKSREEVGYERLKWTGFTSANS